ncbi:DUF2268 domain-containing protein [Aquibacillus kalidii]|uniref:DUF2268 domain-containing protein n=1 Tax=Aquibacillus kalidii TaxID=2762597 RepID=UPI0016464D55|nr:DUF2268 domain-containing putative Zn-dependent protease [Aquibacillus kalidii]
MTIVDTHNWLIAYTKNKKDKFKDNLHVQCDEICEPLLPYFNDVNAYDIHQHLLSHGLFIPDPLDKQIIKKMIKDNQWKSANKVITQLSKLWGGPDVPVFIFPSDHTNKTLRTEFKGRSGLSYHDKVFLFITDTTTKKELQALITHEYNHVTRLNEVNIQEEKLNLLDALVLEGMAELAVKNELGPDHLSNWTSMYSNEFAHKAWNKWIKPNLALKKTNLIHEKIMYGSKVIPKWLGYNVGYHLVSSYNQTHQTSMYDLIRLSSQEILDGSEFG